MSDDKKFILMNLDDERSKKVADVLKSDTAKKILDYISENKEKSEEDISKDLSIPINTIEYNLKKLLDSGLVEKSKNFFWSKKGKKINLYKAANRHIVISPKRGPSMNSLKTILPIIIAAVALIAIIAILANQSSYTQTQNPTELNKFSSLDELNQFLKDNKIDYSGGIRKFSDGVFAAAEAATASDSAAPSPNSGSGDYSQTNIQVAGVDEADSIKTDGKYIYTVSGDKIVILNAYPADNMKILSEIEIQGLGDIFINGDKLVVFANDYSQVVTYDARCMAIGCIMPPYFQEQKTNVFIYDLSDRENPKLENNLSLTGNYVSSRMIDNYVYVVANEYAYGEGVLPMYEIDGQKKIVNADEIYYSPIRDQSFQFTNILSVNVDTLEISEKTVLTGSSQTIYVSQENIYTTYPKYSYYWNPEGTDDVTTIINKFSIDKDKIEFVGSADVPGILLNQFSMDEHEDYFRVATTISGYSNNVDTSTNNLYVLDKNLNPIGEIEGIAPGENIYSIRFIGNRAYMVTFRHVDPLYVLDLKDPENPKILGQLKIPGYSEYLHPYDETHIIGLGKEVDASIDADKVHTEGAVYYTAIQGVKLAIFDVSDVSHPIEMYKEVIGDRGTESPAETDHKAFLFDKEKGLLVIPITVAELESGQEKSEQGQFTFQGAYVYKVNLDDGFDLQGKITHYENDSAFKKSGYYFYGGAQSISRSLYIDNILYTISPAMIKANKLFDLNEISSVDLPYEEQNYYGYGYTESSPGVVGAVDAVPIR